MTTSTASADARRLPRTALAVGFWLVVWQLVAVGLDQPLLLAGPVDVLARLVHLVPTADFWASIARTALRILVGFVGAGVLGSLTATACAAWPVADALAAPLMSVLRATPVVSFIILVLLWADTAWLASIVGLAVVLPVVHTGVLAGIRARDRALLEMAVVFAVPWWRRVLAVDLPAVRPFAVAAGRVGAGLAWKSGVAAEVIGLPAGTVGERMYDAKLLLSSADLLAWTAVVVLASALLERLAVALLDRVPGGQR